MSGVDTDTAVVSAYGCGIQGVIAEVATHTRQHRADHGRHLVAHVLADGGDAGKGRPLLLQGRAHHRNLRGERRS
jgi:hypothetical protein